MGLLVAKIDNFRGAAIKLCQVMSMQNPKTVYCLQMSDLDLNIMDES